MSTRKPRILVAVTPGDDPERFVTDDYEVSILSGGDTASRGALKSAMANADGLIASTRVRLDSEVLLAARKLRVISIVGVGCDKVDLGAVQTLGIVLRTTTGVLERAVAELTIALLLAVSRRLEANSSYLRSGKWHQTAARGRLGTDITGKTLGILGLGKIGHEVSRIAERGFSMNVVYNNRNPQSNGKGQFLPREELLQVSDFVSLHLPLTDETRLSIGQREFGLMRSTAFFINTSRGAIVDEDALIMALEAGGIAGAGLDVMVDEPLPPDHKLCALENVTLLPHIGSSTIETRSSLQQAAARNVMEFFEGRPHHEFDPR